MKLAVVLASWVYNSDRAKLVTEGFRTLLQTMPVKECSLALIVREPTVPFTYPSVRDLKRVFSRRDLIDNSEALGTEATLAFGTHYAIREFDATHICWMGDDALFHPRWLRELVGLITRHPEATAWSVYRSAYVAVHPVEELVGRDARVASVSGHGLTLSRTEWLAYGLEWHSANVVSPLGDTIDLHHAHTRPGDRWVTQQSFVEHTGVVGHHCTEAIPEHADGFAGLPSEDWEATTLRQMATDRQVEIVLCRGCHGIVGKEIQLEPVLSLGEQYLTGFLADGETAHAGDIDLVRCSRCSLLQLKHAFPRDWFYRWYGYRSGINPMMVEALRDLVRSIQERLPLIPGDVVVDIGSNDGTLLRLYQGDDLVKIGFEPAHNLADVGAEGLTRLVPDYFSKAPIQDLLHAHGPAKVVTAIAMFYDLDDPWQFLREVHEMLDQRGLFVLQLNYLVPMLEVAGYDNSCHEHVTHFSLASLKPLLEATGFRVLDVATNQVNGGSFRLYCARSDGPAPTAAGLARIAGMEAAEQAIGLADPATYKLFASRSETTRLALSELIHRLKADGKRIYVYGASTRGLVILQYCGLDSSLIDGAAERNPDKWGRQYSGTGIRCVPEEEARAQADYFLMLPWHFLDEFVIRERAFLERGGRFIVPLPNVRVLGADSRGVIHILDVDHFWQGGILP